MNDREQPELISQSDTSSQSEEASATPAPMLDMEMFTQLREVVRTHYLWHWEESAKITQNVIKDLTSQIAHDAQFRQVGDIEVDDHIFQITLWLEESMAFSLASVDVMMLEALQIDLGRCAILARELTQMGLEYHLVTFGEDRAQEFSINVIGPRMQQIRDLGTLVAPASNSFSA